MPCLSPPTLTTDEQKLILRATAKHPRDHLIISLALGTGLRLGETPTLAGRFWISIGAGNDARLATSIQIPGQLVPSPPRRGYPERRAAVTIAM